MTRDAVTKFSRLAEECRQKAAEATRQVDRQAWLKLAKDWDKLTRGADLRRAWRATPSREFAQKKANYPYNRES
jgi:hypothetical protein